MLPKSIKMFVAGLAIILFGTFVYGLSHSISVGFAGFMGGLPFLLIVIGVSAMAVYDMWNETIRKD